MRRNVTGTMKKRPIPFAADDFVASAVQIHNNVK